jgi:hypothetical protein
MDHFTFTTVHQDHVLVCLSCGRDHPAVEHGYQASPGQGSLPASSQKFHQRLVVIM